MFDANMKHLPKGFEFFAEVHGCKEGGKLHNSGVRKGDVLLCTMLSICNHNPRIKIHLEGTRIEFLRSWEDKERLFEHYLVYSGNKDLTDFLPQEDHVKDKAKKVLEMLK